MDGDSDEDFGSDFLDDSEFLAIATQAEQQLLSTTTNAHTNTNVIRSTAHHPSKGCGGGPGPKAIDINGIGAMTGTAGSFLPPPSQGLLQTTIFGANASNNAATNAHANAHTRSSISINSSGNSSGYNWPRANARSQEPPTHHKIDLEAAKTWVYPVNISFRDYQFNIVRRALLSNVLCALPTGLGKTFIAATVMLNWFRWAPEGQIAFLAPTKPLVHQQIEACFHIAGIPRSQTATMTGGVVKALRQEYWDERRVFFTTPQTMQNDIKNGLCDPKRIVCLVVDEAHRTTGAYAYGEVVKLVRRENTSFRLLALTATPGSTVEAVQGVINALGISRIEIRTDESLDIRQYIQRRHLQVQTFPLSPDMVELRDLYCKCLEPMLKKLNAARAFYQTRAENLTAFAVISQMQQWMNSREARSLNKSHYWSLVKAFKNLASLAHPLVLLNTHGVRLFYDKLVNARDNAGEDEVDQSSLSAIKREPSYAELMSRAAVIVADPNFSGHPKVDFMVNAILQHFAEAESEETKRSTRIMVFTSFRDSAEEVTRLLKRHEPMIRPHVFVGQAAGKNGAGMSQKEQLSIIKQFSEGTFNTIVSTSIGEEGLDIGEVDLIVCYDTSASPIRLLQRMGRTGRKRVGSVLILLTEGREQDSYKKALDNYAVMQRKIASGSDFRFQHDLSPRIIPMAVDPQPDKRHIEIPSENIQDGPERKRPRVKKKAPPKNFFMPEGVKNTGFIKASRVLDKAGRGGTRSGALSTDSSSSSDGGHSDDRKREEVVTETLASQIDIDSEIGLLTEEQEAELERHYKQVALWGTEDKADTVVVIECPNLQAFPEVQRKLTRTKHVSHGECTRRVVATLQRMHDMDDESIEKFRDMYDAALLKSLKKKKKTTAFKPVRPARNPTKGGRVSRKQKEAEAEADGGGDVEMTEVAPEITNPNKTVTRGTGLYKKRRPAPATAAAATAKSKTETVIISDSEGEKGGGEGQGGGKGSAKRQKIGGDGDSESGDGGKGIPGAKDVLSGFRWAGSLGPGKKPSMSLSRR